jgi:hypothetical protein
MDYKLVSSFMKKSNSSNIPRRKKKGDMFLLSSKPVLRENREQHVKHNM